MSDKHSVRHSEDARPGHDSPHPSGPDAQPDPLDYLPSVSASTIVGYCRQKQSPKSIVRFFVGLTVSGAVGLGLGCLILYLILPKHQMQKLTAGFFGSPREAHTHATPSTAAESPRPKVAQSKVSVLPVPHPPRHREEKRELVLVPAKPAKPENQQPAAIPMQPDEPIVENKPQPPRVMAPSPDKPPVAAARTAVEIRREIVLDLSHSVARATFPEAIDGAAEIKIERVTGLGTPHVLKPSHGVILARRPMDIVLPDYPGVSIELSLVMRQGAVVEVAPKVVIGQNKETALTQRWVKQAGITLNKELRWANQQLLGATNAAQEIRLWLKSPGTKSIQMRGARVQQLHVLNEQTIPTLTQNARDAKTRMDSLSRLATFIEQINGVASIHLVMRK